MGIPSFFVWLKKRYPSVVVPAREAEITVVDGHEVPIDATQANPNGFEIDNLYLDMNGIVHPCSRSDEADSVGPSCEEEIFSAVFDYVDHIMTVVRPRKVVYMALDGVAPRAKMNQQRSRRFRSVRDAEQAKAEREAKAERRRRAAEQSFLDGSSSSMDSGGGGDADWFDRNAITPGTEFMDRLAKALRFYVAARISGSLLWKDLEVVLSDSNQPGEGEHKLMAFIRHQRTLPTYSPNTMHCIYGLDADLIMLGLATHEPRFCILREQQFFKTKVCKACGQGDHSATVCPRLAALKATADSAPRFDGKRLARKPYELVLLPLLRQLLHEELFPQRVRLLWKWDLERGIDDWVFMCFLVGNDFLPHLPSMRIVEGAINLLVRKYRELLPTLNGHLSYNGNLNLARVQLFIQAVATAEDEIFLKRKQRDRDEQQRKRQRSLAQKKSADALSSALDGVSSAAILSLYDDAKRPAPLPTASADKMAQMASSGEEALRSVGAVQVSRKRGRLHSSSDDSSLAAGDSPALSESTETPPIDAADDDEERLAAELDAYLNPEDPNYVDKYFAQKFGACDEETKQRVGVSYVQGLVWVLQYYYQGCCSWKWFYPYHYAPFAATIRGISDLQLVWDRAAPFTPFQQLMSVLPPASAQLVPACLRPLMTELDSPIADFYPRDFDTDMNGEVKEWKAVSLLAFIREDRLLDAMRPFEQQLTAEERRRNSIRCELIAFSTGHPLAALIGPLVDPTKRAYFFPNQHVGRPSCGGSLSAPPADEQLPAVGVEVASPLPLYIDHIRRNTAIFCNYHLPDTQPGHIFSSALLRGQTPIDLRHLIQQHQHQHHQHHQQQRAQAAYGAAGYQWSSGPFVYQAPPVAAAAPSYYDAVQAQQAVYAGQHVPQQFYHSYPQQPYPHYQQQPYPHYQQQPYPHYQQPGHFAPPSHFAPSSSSSSSSSSSQSGPRPFYR